MKLIKRISTSLSASLGHAVDRIENHEAIIEAAIKQARGELAKTQSRLSTLRRKDTKLKEQLREIQTQYSKWGDRAKKVAHVDESQALQCMSRRKQCSQEIAQIELAIKENIKLDSELGDNINHMQTRINEITIQQNQLRSKQSKAEVNQLCHNSKVNEDLDMVFERWETSVLSKDTDLSDTNSSIFVDEMDAEFSQEELDLELRDELAQLIHEETEVVNNNQEVSNDK